MIASLPLSDPMVPEHDDFRKLLTATSELHKLDFRRQVRALWQCDATRRDACDVTRCDATRRDAALCGYCCAVLASTRSGVSCTTIRTYRCGHTVTPASEELHGSLPVAVAQLLPIVVNALWAHMRTRVTE